MEKVVHTLEVVIDLHEMEKIHGKVAQETWLNTQLADVGIPVIGAFSFRGVLRGVLKTKLDTEAFTLTCTWEEEQFESS